MAELNDQQKLKIVLALARFETLADIAKTFREEDGLDLPAVQIGMYDPTRTYFEAGDRWRAIFAEERQRYLTDVQAVPIANQAFRLNALQESYTAAVRSKNRVLANQTLRQAAEEVGGALTNERNVKVTRPLDEVTADERRAMFAEVIAKALEAKDPPGAQPTQPGVH